MGGRAAPPHLAAWLTADWPDGGRQMALASRPAACLLSATLSSRRRRPPCSPCRRRRPSLIDRASGEGKAAFRVAIGRLARSRPIRLA